MSDQNNIEANEIVEAPQSGEKPKEKSIEEQFDETERNNNSFLRRIDETFTKLKKTSKVDLTEEQAQLDALTTELDTLTTTTKKSLRDRVKEKAQGVAQSVTGKKDKVIGAVASVAEKVDEEKSWEHIRKPQLIKLFTEAGFSNPESTAEVVRYLESRMDSVTTKYKSDGTEDGTITESYRFSSVDTEKIRKITEGIDDPIQFLNQIQNIVEIPNKYQLEDFSDYIVVLKSTPNLQEFLKIAPQLGPIRTYWDIGIPKDTFMREYSKPLGAKLQHDPLLQILMLEKDEFNALFTPDTIGWIRDFNLSRIDEQNIHRKESPDKYISDLGISIVELQDLAAIVSEGEDNKNFLTDFLDKTESKIVPYGLHTAIQEFNILREAIPGVDKLYAIGFDMSRLYHKPRSLTNSKLYTRAKEILNNPTYCENAKLLHDYGYRVQILDDSFSDPELYTIEDSRILKKALKIGNPTNDHKAIPAYNLKKIIEKTQSNIDSVGGIPEDESLDEYIDDDGLVTLKFINKMSEAVFKPPYNDRVLDSMLTSDVLAKMPDPDQKFWRRYVELKGSITLESSRKMLEHRNNPDFFQGGAVTYAFIQEVLSANIHRVYDASMLMTPEIISTLPPEEATLWSAIVMAPTSDVQEFLYTNKNEVRKYFKDGLPTAELLDHYTKHNKMGFGSSILSRLVTDEVIASLQGDDKEFWGFYNNSKGSAMAEFLIDNKGNLGGMVVDGKVTRSFIQYVVSQEDSTILNTLLSSNPELLGDVFSDQEKSLVEKWKSLNPDLQKNVIKSGTNFPFISEEEFELFSLRFEIMQQVQDSPSQEVKRLEKEITEQLMSTEDPISAFARIEDIFIKNNLPLFGKIYRIFETLYDSPRRGAGTLMEDIIRDRPVSPTLREATPGQRRNLIYQDLLRVHVESDNPSLRKFIGVLAETQGLMDRIQGESGSVETLTPAEQEKLSYFLNKMDTLYINSLFGRTLEERKRERDPENYKGPSTGNLALSERVVTLQKNFRVRSDQKLTDRLLEMFAAPLGKESLEEVLDTMTQTKVIADRRNREQAQQGKIEVAPSDLFKAVKSQYIANILENGSVAKEFLGSSADSDSTPLDTDVSMILETDGTEILTALSKSLSIKGNYGNLHLLIKNKGQFEGESGYDLFHSGVIASEGGRHYGIRTGFASTEIDAMIDMQDDAAERERIQFAIARNGFYIPLLDRNGTIVFTPEMYDEYRKTFEGVKEYSDEIPTVIPLSETPRVSPEVVQTTEDQVRALVADIQSGMDGIDGARGKVRTIVQEVLQERGVALRAPYDTSVYGAEFDDTGSTGRYTNIPGDFDFDLSLRLDGRDARRMGEIADEIKRRLNPDEDKSHAEPHRDYIQIRAIKSHVEGLDPLDIDIGVGRRSDAEVLASHDAVRAKLDSIQENYGDEQYFDVLANIVLTKQILKAAHAYKKGENADGGLGGIGVENWILANGGNMLEAFRTFYDAAHAGDTMIPMEEFKSKYKVFDAGTNLKQADLVENHIAKLTEQGYRAMISAIGEYLQGQTS